jgi:hypothetical protein
MKNYLKKNKSRQTRVNNFLGSPLESGITPILGLPTKRPEEELSEIISTTSSISPSAILVLNEGGHRISNDNIEKLRDQLISDTHVSGLSHVAIACVVLYDLIRRANRANTNGLIPELKEHLKERCNLLKGVLTNIQFFQEENTTDNVVIKTNKKYRAIFLKLFKSLTVSVPDTNSSIDALEQLTTGKEDFFKAAIEEKFNSILGLIENASPNPNVLEYVKQKLEVGFMKLFINPDYSLRFDLYSHDIRNFKTPNINLIKAHFGNIPVQPRPQQVQSEPALTHEEVLWRDLVDAKNQATTDYDELVEILKTRLSELDKYNDLLKDPTVSEGDKQSVQTEILTVLYSATSSPSESQTHVDYAFGTKLQHEAEELNETGSTSPYGLGGGRRRRKTQKRLRKNPRVKSMKPKKRHHRRKSRTLRKKNQQGVTKKR